MIGRCISVVTAEPLYGGWARCSKDAGHPHGHYSLQFDIAWVQDMNLPQYKCHKVVKAAKIKEIPHPLQGVLVLELPDGAEFRAQVSDSFWGRNKPQAGGYFVMYDDGYMSYSPAAAFEAGYTLLDSTETPTREQLQALVQRTADALQRLMVDYPIEWEGGIDAAMEAACKRIRGLEEDRGVPPMSEVKD